MFKLTVMEDGYELFSHGVDIDQLKEELIDINENGMGGCSCCVDSWGKPLWQHRDNLEEVLSSSTWEELTLGLAQIFEVKEEKGQLTWGSDIWEGVEVRVERE